MPWETSVGDREYLGLSDDEKIRWHLPIAFVRMKPAAEKLVRDFEPEGPEREPADGVSVLAMASFDEKGFPVESELILSSFGWAFGEVLAGHIDELHCYSDEEDGRCREIAAALVERAEDGLQLPTTINGFKRCMAKAMDLLKLPKEILERPRVAIRIIGDNDKEPVDIINSFFLRDLHRVRTAIEQDQAGVAIQTYLAQELSSEEHDILKNHAVLEELLAPRIFRWPGGQPPGQQSWSPYNRLPSMLQQAVWQVAACWRSMVHPVPARRHCYVTWSRA